MNAPPYQKLFWGSYHKHTSHLSHAAQHGAYLLLIGALWNNGGRLEADDDTLAAYAKLSLEEWSAIKPKLLMPGMLKIVRGKLTQARVTEDLAKYRDTSGKRKEAGKAGGMASAGKIKENRPAIASDLPTKPEPEPYTETPVVPKGTDEGSTSNGIVLRQAHVDQAWEITPRSARTRTSRKDIQAALQSAARRGKRPDDIIAGLRAYYASSDATKDGGQFAKGAHRIIANDRWEGFVDGQTPLEALAASAPEDPAALWRRRMGWLADGSVPWRDEWGPRPGKPACTVPADILREFGIGADVLPFEGRAA